MISSGFSAQNCSNAAPGPRGVHFSASILDILSMHCPTLSSTVVARTRNEVNDCDSTRSVWPPETSNVRNGN